MKRLHLLVVYAMLLATSLLWASAAKAEDTGIGTEFPTLLRGVRPLGMGNAFLAMPGADYNAQFYNPAAINDYEKKHHFLFLSPAVQFNTGLYGAVKDVFSLKDDLNRETTSSGKLNVFNTFVSQRVGDYHHAELGLPLFHIRHKYYAAGVIVDGRTTISLRNQNIENFEVKADAVGGVVGGGAYAFFDDALQVGGNLKVLYKTSIEERVTSNEVIPPNSLGDRLGFNQWKKGFGVGVDLGTKYALPIWQELLRPTVAVTIQDVADTRFSGGAPKTPMSASAGVGIFPKFGEIQLAALVDFRELNVRQDILKKIHAGLEATFPKFLATIASIRAGANQGYPAAGLSLKWPIVALNFAFYGEELGEFTREKASYRLAGQLTLGF